MGTFTGSYKNHRTAVMAVKGLKSMNIFMRSS